MDATSSPSQTKAETIDGGASASALFARGFLALMPLWTGAIPVGVAYAVAARDAGLSAVTTQLMSLTVFSAAAQLSVVSLYAHGTPVVVMILTALTLNLQLSLFGLTTARSDRASLPRRLLSAYFLTDGAFAIAAAGGRVRLPVLLGAGVSMFTAWNAGTLIGAAAGAILPDLSRAGVDFVAPLTFLAVLVPLVRSRPAVVTAIVAALTALAVSRFFPSGIAVLAAGLSGSVAGSWLTGRPREASLGGDRL